jgi:Lrp/AsnC family transcriptional regulator, leucine-responsive regulatory protein
MTLDHIDMKLLNALQNDASRSTAALAEEIGLTNTPCYRRQRLLEQNGIIRRYVSLLDQDKLGLKVSVFVEVELTSQDDDAISAFEDEVKRLPEVMECYLMTGDTDYLLRVVARDIGEYERFLKTKLTRVTAVRTIRSSFALRRVVYKTALPLELVEAG